MWTLVVSGINEFKGVEHLSRDTFELIYDGSEIHDGEMDVYALAPALLAMGDLFREADATINGSTTVVTTAVKAEFREGSFEIVMSVDQQLRDAAIGLIPTLHLIGADKLIATVVGEAWDVAKDKIQEKMPEVFMGLLKLIGKLGGEKPKEIRYDESSNSSIFVLGNNNTIKVDQRTTQLYQSSRTLSAATRVASPLRRQGISDLKVKKSSREIAALTRDDFPNLEDALSTESLAVSSGSSSTPIPQEMIIRMVKPSFTDGSWSVSDGGKPFSVTMDDDDFKARVHAREVGFFDGDLYRVQMITWQKLTGKRISTNRSIIRVIEPIQAEEQQAFSLDEFDSARQAGAVSKKRRNGR